MTTSRRKKRVTIPAAIAAKVLFSSDRTCCVCRIAGRKIQIHHIDDDPSNNSFSNLAVLCLECHGETQIIGGFGRKLDAEQVILYRDDWHSTVTGQRIQLYRDTSAQLPDNEQRIKYITALVERLREASDYITLASVYSDLGNEELRDKYVEKALTPDSPDWLVIYLRAMQNQRDRIPEEVAERRLAQQADQKEWNNRARTLVKLGRYVDAAHDYIRSIHRSLDSGRPFAAAFYLKELNREGIINKLLECALQEAADRDDLWWQVRALQELGWQSELDELVLANEARIKSYRDSKPLLLALLYKAKGDQQSADRVRVEVFGSVSRRGERVSIPKLTEEFRDSLGETNVAEPNLPNQDGS